MEERPFQGRVGKAYSMGFSPGAYDSDHRSGKSGFSAPVSAIRLALR